MDQGGKFLGYNPSFRFNPANHASSGHVDIMNSNYKYIDFQAII